MHAAFKETVLLLPHNIAKAPEIKKWLRCVNISEVFQFFCKEICGGFKCHLTFSS